MCDLIMDDDITTRKTTRDCDVPFPMENCNHLTLLAIALINNVGSEKNMTYTSYFHTHTPSFSEQRRQSHVEEDTKKMNGSTY